MAVVSKSEDSVQKLSMRLFRGFPFSFQASDDEQDGDFILLFRLARLDAAAAAFEEDDDESSLVFRGRLLLVRVDDAVVVVVPAVLLADATGELPESTTCEAVAVVAAAFVAPAAAAFCFNNSLALTSSIELLRVLLLDGFVGGLLPLALLLLVLALEAPLLFVLFESAAAAAAVEAAAAALCGLTAPVLVFVRKGGRGLLAVVLVGRTGEDDGAGGNNNPLRSRVGNVDKRIVKSRNASSNCCCCCRSGLLVLLAAPTNVRRSNAFDTASAVVACFIPIPY